MSDLVILVGGKGKRLGKITQKIPKPLLKINNKNFLDILLAKLIKYNFDNIYLLCSFKKKQFFDRYHKTKVHNSKIFCIDEGLPRGNGGALYKIKNRIKKSFFLINGDSFLDIDLNILKNINQKNIIGSIAITNNYNYKKNSKIINLKISKSGLLSFSKYKTNLMNGGIYFFKKKIFKYIENKHISLEYEILNKLINKNQIVGCYSKNRFMRCHCEPGTSNDLNKAIYNSCNTYFATIYKNTLNKYSSSKEGMNNWKNHVESFGLGNYLGYDHPLGRPGLIPDAKYYDKWYPNNRWRAATTISNGIGQGEILTTPIQLANMTAAIANEGYYFTPHIIKSIQGETINNKFTAKINTTIDSKYFDPVIEGMSKVYTNGTASFLKIPGISVCGKNGTAENFTKINGVKTQLTDHSIFIAFAPKENPKIAISVLVENGYYGARWAGRIASLMIEKYLNGEVTLKNMERLVLNKSLESEYLKPYSNKPFKINQ